MANKIRYGLRNTKYAIRQSDGTFAAPKPMPGAVSLSLSREGGDSSDFYADDGIYYTFSGTNGGYSGDLQLARITDTIRADLLSEVLDEATGVMYEVTDAKEVEFALITEMQGDKNPIGFVFYSCKASRPELSANTKNDSPDVDTDTLNLRIASIEATIGGESKKLVQSHIEKTSENATKFAAFFNSVVIPGDTESSETEPEPAGESGESGVSGISA